MTVWVCFVRSCVHKHHQSFHTRSCNENIIIHHQMRLNLNLTACFNVKQCCYIFFSLSVFFSRFTFAFKFRRQRRLILDIYCWRIQYSAFLQIEFPSMSATFRLAVLCWSFVIWFIDWRSFYRSLFSVNGNWNVPKLKCRKMNNSLDVQYIHTAVIIFIRLVCFRVWHRPKIWTSWKKSRIPFFFLNSFVCCCALVELETSMAMKLMCLHF